MKRGNIIRISAPRRLVMDMLHFGKQIPTVPVQRTMSLGPVVEARRLSAKPISWTVLFTKAFAITALEYPDLRRSYLAFPSPHIYEHTCSIASVAVERDYQGEKAVLFGHLRAPEEQSLRDLDAALKDYRTRPVESYGLFRRAIKMSKLPRILRRAMWWIALNVSGFKKAKRLGTFGVSVYSSLGAESLHPISPLTCTLNYGVLEADGSVAVRIIYDHRIMDGATVARALEHLEKVMLGAIVEELRADAAASNQVPTQSSDPGNTQHAA